MGNAFDNLCCISNDDLLDSNNMMSNSEQESSYSIENGQFDPKFLYSNGSIPCSQTAFNKLYVNPRIKNLSSLPISLVNLIREHKGNL